jgi:hypothetical protein
MRRAKAGPQNPSVYLRAYRRDLDGKARLVAACSAIALLITPILRKHRTRIFGCAVFAACVMIAASVVRSSPGWLKERLPDAAVAVKRVLPAKADATYRSVPDTVTGGGTKPQISAPSRHAVKAARRRSHSSTRTLSRTTTAQLPSELYGIK